MAQFVYTEAKRALLAGEIDFDTDDIRVKLVMNATTCDTEKDVTTLVGFTLIDEGDGTNYVEKALTGEAVSNDDANDRGEFTADAVTWTALGAGASAYTAVLLYKFVTGPTDSIPIAYLDNDFPFTGNGSNVTWTPHADGILQAT